MQVPTRRSATELFADKQKLLRLGCVIIVISRSPLRSAAKRRGVSTTRLLNQFQRQGLSENSLLFTYLIKKKRWVLGLFKKMRWYSAMQRDSVFFHVKVSPIKINRAKTAYFCSFYV